MSSLTLKIVTPEGVDRTVCCESISLWMAPDTKGKGEGSIGIRKGHVDAVIALGKGPIEGRENGQTIFSAQSDGGFATVLKDVVTIVTPHVEIINS